jgi:hypothetical protein
MNRRSFLFRLVGTVASFLLGRCAAGPNHPAFACIPKDQETAPAPDLDLLKEFRSDGCLTRDDLDRVAEIAMERACPVEPMTFHGEPLIDDETAMYEATGLPKDDHARHVQLQREFLRVYKKEFIRMYNEPTPLLEFDAWNR